MPKPTDKDRSWARAYARQALSDLDARDALADAPGTSPAKCHRLHFLQMAAEKTCKAYFSIANGHHNLKRSHAYVEKHLPAIAKQFYSRLNANTTIATWQLRQVRAMAQEIELLAPACDAGETRQDNTEYPWEDGAQNIRIPAEYSFPKLDDGSKAIILIIKLLRSAAGEYAE